MAMLRVGLTGGIGSGKSTVGRVLVACGATLVDADAIAQQLTAPGGLALAEIVHQFGPQTMASDGSMDRARMRALVFDNPRLKAQLEAIIHPLVSQQALQQSQDALRAGARCLVFDVPLLVESGRWRQQLDRIVVVACDPATQVARVVARSGLTRDMVEKIMAAQASQAQRLAAADSCLYNEGLSLAALDGLVRQLAHRYGLEVAEQHKQ